METETNIIVSYAMKINSGQKLTTRRNWEIKWCSEVLESHDILCHRGEVIYL